VTVYSTQALWSLQKAFSLPPLHSGNTIPAFYFVVAKSFQLASTPFTYRDPCIYFSQQSTFSSLFLQVRLNFLSQLLHEAYGYLHSFLTASILNRKLMHHPMQRDVEIMPEGAAALRASLAHCKKVGLCEETCILTGLENIPVGIYESVHK